MSQKSPLVVPLLRCPIFQGLDAGQLEAIAKIAERSLVAEGQVIARADEPAEGAILIVHGAAHAQRGAGVTPRTLEPGALIGELAMLVETTFASTVTAATPARLMKIARADLYRLMNEERRIAAHFAAKIGERLQSLIAEVRQIEAGIGRQLEGPVKAPPLPKPSLPVQVFPSPRPQLPPTYVPDPSKLLLAK